MAKKGEKAEKASTAKKATVKKPVVKKEPAAKAKKTRVMPSVSLSAELGAVIGTETSTRGDVLKKIWDYIRAHDLQDPTNKRMIRPDAALAKVFETREPVDMFQMTSLLGKHIGVEKK